MVLLLQMERFIIYLFVLSVFPLWVRLLLCHQSHFPRNSSVIPKIQPFGEKSLKVKDNLLGLWSSSNTYLPQNEKKTASFLQFYSVCLCFLFILVLLRWHFCNFIETVIPHVLLWGWCFPQGQSLQMEKDCWTWIIDISHKVLDGERWAYSICTENIRSRTVSRCLSVLQDSFYTLGRRWIFWLQQV